MRIAEDIKKLPDYMDKDDINKYFVQMLDYAESGQISSNDEITEALWELSNRQWHTYTLIDDDIKGRIESWIFKVWNLNDRKCVDLIVGIIGMLGIRGGIDLLKDALNQDLKEEYKEDLINEIERLKKRVVDPYCSLKKEC